MTIFRLNPCWQTCISGRFVSFLLGLLLVASIGCQPVDTTPIAPNTSSNTKPTSAEANLNAEHDDDSPIEVVLGDPALTRGIPGEGSLTIDEIKSFINDPDNHRRLNFKLPMGLAAAEANMVGIEENPMTLAKIELGRQLFFDTRLSADNTVSCASCHHPDSGYTKAERFGVGINDQEGDRNSSITYNRILSSAQYWDGRAGSLEAQALDPIEDPLEMGNTHENCVKTLSDIKGYHVQFEKIFPDGVTIVNVGKSIATFERTLVTGPAGYDYLEVVRGVESQWGEDIDELEEEDPDLFAEYANAQKVVANLSESAIRGRDLFFSVETNCAACHAGANFSDERYYNIGVGMEVDNPDVGRFAETNMGIDRGAFKTPTVRNVAMSAPYMHDGSQETLADVVEWYAKGGHSNPFLSDRVSEIDMTDQDKADLVAFMKEGLTSELPTVESGRLPE